MTLEKRDVTEKDANVFVKLRQHMMVLAKLRNITAIVCIDMTHGVSIFVTSSDFYYTVTKLLTSNISSFHFLSEGGTDDYTDTDVGVENEGQECWWNCGGQEGHCWWCGVEGMCCRQGWVGNGCDGNVGGPNNHQCTKAPGGKTFLALIVSNQD